MLISIQVDKNLTERVTCYVVHAPPFADLCGSDEADSNNANPSIIDKTTSYLGFIVYGTKDKLLGKGTFKTAHLVSLQWLSNTPPAGFESQGVNSIAVALKRPYNEKQKAKMVKRFNYMDESHKILTEATSLGWADSLLQFAYDFINDYIQKNNLSDNPLSIPRLRFVKGLVAYAEKPLGKSGSRQTSHCAAYLLEELLPTDKEFIKYIHNGNAVPLQDPDESGYDTAVFLCFIQHIQFLNTHGQVYTSDFQGTSPPLYFEHKLNTVCVI